MRRIAALVVAGCLSTTVVALVPTAATAAPARLSVTLRASATHVAEGRTVRLAGRVTGGGSPRRVALQKRTITGWATVARRVLSTDRRYTFQVTPHGGRPIYRTQVTAPTPAGVRRSASPRVALVVRWQPTVVMSSAPRFQDGTESLHLTGEIRRSPSAPTVEVQYRDGSDQWVTTQTLHPGDPTSFATDVSGPRFRQYRFVLEPSAVTFAAESATATIDRGSYDLSMDAGVVLPSLASGPHAAVVHLQAQAGDDVTLAAPTCCTSSWTATVTAPSGTQVAVLHPDGVRFTAPETGRYVIDFTGDDGTGFTLWASTPKVVTATLDGPKISVTGDVPGQLVFVRVDLAEGQLFSAEDTVTTSTTADPQGRLLDPEGNPVPVVLPRAVGHYDDIVRAPSTGTFTYEYDHAQPDTNEFWVTSIPWVDATVDAAQFAVHPTPYRPVIVSADLAPGDTISTDGDSSSSIRYYDSDTQHWVDDTSSGHIWALVESVLGASPTVDVQVRSPIQLTGTLDGVATHVTAPASFFRGVDIAFTGHKGDVVTNPVSTTAGRVYGGELDDPQGHPVLDLWDSYGVWVLPADGTYTLRYYVDGGTDAEASLASVAHGDVTPDGTPVTVSLTHPQDPGFEYPQYVARVTATPGAHLSVTTDQVDADLVGAWFADLIGAGDQTDDAFLDHEQTVSYTADSSGVFYLAFGIDGQHSGSLRLTVSPST